MKAAAVAFAVVVLLATCHAYPRFEQELPAIPVVDGSPWPGVGHTAREGGGARNPFGQDFDAAGYKWTPELCNKDSDGDGFTNGQVNSDGDGFTNGQELGDPECTWVKGQPQVTNSAGISHPGLPNSVPAQPAAGGRK